jgi:hypothetical protein
MWNNLASVIYYYNIYKTEKVDDEQTLPHVVINAYMYTG